MIACEFCDLLSRPVPLRPGGTAICRRCGGVLATSSRNPIEGVLALGLAAALLLVLANIYPFLHFSLKGEAQENKIITGVIRLWTAGQGGLAMLILFTTVLAPALRIGALLYVLVPLSLRRVPPGLAGALRFQQALVSWAMLDVYMLALLVALVKLAQMAEVQIELGAFCFVGLFVVLTMVNALYDRQALWDRWEALQ
jgi:paraquat-inducible protein A